MTKNITVPCLATVSVLACSDNNVTEPEIETPTYTTIYFSGMTKTDAIGNIMSIVDTTDWHFEERWFYFEYKKEGCVFERRKKEFREYRYQFFTQDSWAYSDSTNATVKKYQILHLDPKQLVLKKRHNPFLPGNNQELYEIRYTCNAKQWNA